MMPSTTLEVPTETSTVNPATVEAKPLEDQSSSTSAKPLSRIVDMITADAQVRAGQYLMRCNVGQDGE